MVPSDAEIEARLADLRRRREALDREIADHVLYLELGRRLRGGSGETAPGSAASGPTADVSAAVSVPGAAPVQAGPPGAGAGAPAPGPAPWDPQAAAGMGTDRAWRFEPGSGPAPDLPGGPAPAAGPGSGAVAPRVHTPHAQALRTQASQTPGPAAPPAGPGPAAPMPASGPPSPGFAPPARPGPAEWPGSGAGDGAEAPPPAVSFEADPAAARRYGRALVDAALAVLDAAGRPMHAGEILERLAARGFTVPGQDPVAALNTRLWKRSGPGGPLRRLGDAVYDRADAGDPLGLGPFGRGLPELR